MWIHSYTTHDRYGDREHHKGLNWGPMVVLVTVLVCLIILTGVAFRVSEGHRVERDTLNTAYISLEAEKAMLLDTSAAMLMKYENLQCSTRGLVVTTVKGITLCMDPATKALHKIDDKAD